jgi:hypothetical protein
MGAWGDGIEQDDTVLDVLGTFADALRVAQDVPAASAKVREEFAHLFAAPDADPDDAVQARIGLALAQWRYGALEPALLDAVRDDLVARRGIDSYRDPAAREKVVRRFVAKLAAPNPRPKAMPKPPKAPKRPVKPKPAAFAAGECLVFRLPTGAIRGALVLATDVTDAGHGFNVIARLDWPGTTPPTLDDFAACARRDEGRSPRWRTLGIAMFPWAPYTGTLAPERLGTVDVDPARFGVAPWPDCGSWQFVDAAAGGKGLWWLQWEQLVGSPI